MYKIVTFTLSMLVVNTALSQHYQSVDWVTDGLFTQGVEGPAVNKNGDLYAVNYGQEGTIGKVINKDNVEVFITLENGSVGNGIRFDALDNMYIADYVNHNILQVKAGESVATVYAHNDLMNQPNDLAIMDNGILFASDPNWQSSKGQIWRISTDGKVKLLEANMGTTNGIEVSPDNKKLYVNESVQRRVWVYDIDSTGNINNKKLLIQFNDFGMDGMRTDVEGNLFIARYGKGVIAVVSPAGKLLREIALKGKHPTNVAFGGEKGKTVFVTMQKRGAIERFETKLPGRNYR